MSYITLHISKGEGGGCTRAFWLKRAPNFPTHPHHLFFPRGRADPSRAVETPLARDAFPGAHLLRWREPGARLLRWRLSLRTSP